MKVVIYIFFSLLIFFFAWQIFSAQTNNKYEFLQNEYLGKKNGIEFKVYNHYTKASVNMKYGKMKSANSKFSVLANYIFGGNEKNAQIKMTAPVLYNMDTNSSFSFLMPYEWENNLPKPDTDEIFFSNVSEQCVGILKFGGFVKNNRAQKKVNELRDKLSALNLNYSNDFIIAVYQPPYQLINRKNEIWIEVNKAQVSKLFNK